MSEPWWASPTDARRAAGRTWTLRGLLSGVAAGAMLIVGATVAVTAPHAPSTTTLAYGHDERPSVRALAMGCGPIQFVTDPGSKVGTVDYDGDLTYYPTAPASGWFSSHRPADDDPTARPEEVLHAMWYGARAIWVSPDAPEGVQEALVRAAVAHPAWRATVRQWPAGRVDQLDGAFAVAAWGVTQTCETPDVQVIDDLFAHAGPAPGAYGTAPPAMNPSAD